MDWRKAVGKGRKKTEGGREDLGEKPTSILGMHRSGKRKPDEARIKELRERLLAAEIGRDRYKKLYDEASTALREKSTQVELLSDMLAVAQLDLEKCSMKLVDTEIRSEAFMWELARLRGDVGDDQILIPPGADGLFIPDEGEVETDGRIVTEAKQRQREELGVMDREEKEEKGSVSVPARLLKVVVLEAIGLQTTTGGDIHPRCEVTFGDETQQTATHKATSEPPFQFYPRVWKDNSSWW